MTAPNAFKMQPAAPAERRIQPRQIITRPCKVFRPATQRYAAAVMRDFSAAGVLLEIDSPRRLRPGERLDVGIAWTRSAILSEAAMHRGTVVRVRDLDEDRQAVAVQFAAAGALQGRRAA